MPNLVDVIALEKGEPKAIVILFGWLGSQLRNVRKYASLYVERECSAVIAIGDVTASMTTFKPVLDKCVDEAVHEAAKLLRAAPKDTPVITHCFSGGGVFLLERLETFYANPSISKSKKKNAEDYKIVGDAIGLGGQLYDSCPVSLTLKSGLMGIGAGVKMVVLRKIIQGIFLVSALLNAAVSALQGRMNRPQTHWHHVCNQTMSLRQGYIYSTADTITDSTKIDELIEYRRNKLGADITVRKFKDSRHVLHYLKYPKEYLETLDLFLGKVLKGRPEPKF